MAAGLTLSREEGTGVGLMKSLARAGTVRTDADRARARTKSAAQSRFMGASQGATRS